ncbi:MAG: phospholipid carrier-dependent glycosyltransferase [Candidatus Woesearchaeota archaeon]
MYPENFLYFSNPTNELGIRILVVHIAHNLIPYFVILTFIVLLWLVWLSWRDIADSLSRIKARTWLILAVIFFLALGIRLYFPLHRHIIYIDEPWYLEAGKDLLTTAQQGDYPKSIGWPFLISLFFGLFGVSNWVPIYLNIFLGAATVVPMFLFAYMITRREDLALAASFIFSLFPAHIIWSGSAETNISSVFFILCSAYFWLLFYTQKKAKKTSNQKPHLLWLAAVSLAFCMQIRPENLVLVTLFLFGALHYNASFRSIVLPLSVSIFLALPNLIQVLDFHMSVDWVASDTFGNMEGLNWSISNLIDNTLAYYLLVFGSTYQPIIVLPFVLAGVIIMFPRKTKEAIFITEWFVLFWLTYFSSWFQTLAGKERFFITIYPIMAIFLVYGIYGLDNAFFARLNRPLIKQNGMLIITLSVALLFLPYVSGTSAYYADGRILETQIPEQAEKTIPKECVIIANWPTILRSSTELRVADAQNFMESEFLRNILMNRSCVLFFEDLTCLGWDEAGLYEQCEHIKTEFNAQPFLAYSIKDNSRNSVLGNINATYTFYRLSSGKPLCASTLQKYTSPHQSMFC